MRYGVLWGRGSWGSEKIVGPSVGLFACDVCEVL